jgi:S-adenosylmethionine hydrolase
MPILTLTTDFGLDDYYVAAVKGVVLRLAPGTVLVDVSHQIPPGDLQGAGFVLAAASPWFPAGTVHLAVVDPGVGSARRILAAETGEAVFLAPDNGLLTPVFPRCAAVRSVERPDLHLPDGGATFHGRDRFAPIAAALLRGESPAALGPEIADPVRLDAPPPVRENSRAAGRVIHVDRYGNLVTDLPASWLPDSGAVSWSAEIEGGSARPRRRITRSASHYAEIPPGEAALVAGSCGTLEASLRGESLALRWNVRRGDRICSRWKPRSGAK